MVDCLVECMCGRYSVWGLLGTHLFEMMRHLYLSRYKLFYYMYVHIVVTNELHLNKKKSAWWSVWYSVWWTAW